MLSIFQGVVLTSVHFINLFVLSVLGLFIGGALSGSIMINVFGVKEVREGSTLFWLANTFNLLTMLVVMFYIDVYYLTFFF